MYAAVGESRRALAQRMRSVPYPSLHHVPREISQVLGVVVILELVKRG